MTVAFDRRAAEALLEDAQRAIDELAGVADRCPSFLRWCWPPTRARYDRQWEEAKARADAAVAAAERAIGVTAACSRKRQP